MQAPFADPLAGLDLLNKALPLVDRETEMQVMRLLLNTVLLDLPEGPRALTITGEMGVGKSRLLAEMYAEARTLGFRVLEGHTYESGNMFPYLPFIEALRPVLRSSTPEQLRRYVGLAFSLDASDANKQQRSQRNEENISLVGMPLIVALARLFPELPKMLGETGEASGTSPAEILSLDQEKFRLLDAVATLLEHVAMDQPVLLGIDNLQWADSASLELTMYLTVRLHRSRVALVGATRPPKMLSERMDSNDSVVTTNASNTAARALVEMMRQRLLLLLPLGPLSPSAASQHLHALLPGTLPESLAQVLLDRAEGNPFFLEELVRMLTLNRHLVLHGNRWQATKAISTELPDSIMLAVGQRLQELSAGCRELLRVASLFGRTFPFAALLKVFEDTEESRILSLIDEATQAAIIAIVPAATSNANDASWLEDDTSYTSSIDPISTSQLAPLTYMFCQGIVQEVLSAQIPKHQASSLHGVIGTALEATYAHAASAHAAELARHYVLGGKKAAALHWNLLAGEDAVRQQAHREAIGHFRLVMWLLEAGETSTQAPSLAQLYITIGELWFKLGELEQAAHSFLQALEQLQQSSYSAPGRPQGPPHLQLAQANRLLADVYRMQGRYDQALAHLQVAHTALDAGRYEEKSSQTGHSAFAPWFPGRNFPGGSNVLTLERISTAERILLLQAQATVDILLLREKEAEAALWQSHQLATEIGDRGSQAFALHFVGYLRGWGEHIYEAIRLLEQAHELYIAIGDPFRAVLGDHALGIIYQALGEMERAHLYTLRGFERARRYGARYNLGWLHWNFGAIALARGDWTGSASHLQEAMGEAEATNNLRLKPLVMQAQAELYFRQGNWQQAEHYFQESIQAATNTEWYPGTVALYGHFLAVTGQRTAARTQLDRAGDSPEPPGYGGDFYIPFLAEGYLHLEANEKAAGYVERIRPLRGFMYYGNSVDRVLGVVAARSGDWAMAEQAFEAGLALCRRANNQPEEATILYEQARALLVQSGLEPEQDQRQILQRVHILCDQARKLFLQYKMQRAVDLVDTLLEGLWQLEQRNTPGARREDKSGRVAQVQERDRVAHPQYHLDLTLTRREQEVLRLVAEGHTDREVAETLVISPRTVNRHLSNIFVKLDVPGRAAAVAYAIRQGLV
ncbi:MAG: helix-turn-helix transcriptional regulator [Ktedonobacteraceae bacterium]